MREILVQKLRQAGSKEAALLIFLVAGATIAGAWVYQGLGYAPCELCLKERIPYYFAIPLAGLSYVLARRGRDGLAAAALGGLAIVFFVCAIIGAYHAGVEWKLWPGPTDCTGAFAKPASNADFLRQLENVKVVRCDEPALKVLGLSLAAWYGLISAGLAVVAGFGAARADRNQSLSRPD